MKTRKITAARMLCTGSVTMIPKKNQTFSAAAKGAFLKADDDGNVPHFKTTLYDANGNPVVIEGVCRPSQGGNITCQFVLHGLQFEAYWSPAKDKSGKTVEPVNGDEALNALL